MADTEKVTEFEEYMIPLDIAITMVFKRELEKDIPEHFSKYGRDCLSNPNSLIELNDMLKAHVAKVLSLIAKDYRKRLRKVYTDDGIIYYIYSNLHNMLSTDIEDRISRLTK